MISQSTEKIGAKHALNSSEMSLIREKAAQLVVVSIFARSPIFWQALVHVHIITHAPFCCRSKTKGNTVNERS